MKYDVKADLEKAAKLAEDARSIVDNAKSEKREMNADEEKQFDTLMDEHQKAENNANRKAKLNEVFDSRTEKIEKIAEKEERSVNAVEDDKKMAKQVLRSYLVKGVNGLNAEERAFMQRAQSTTTDSEGGYTVDATMGNMIIETMEQFGGMRSVCDVQTTSQGNQINWPTNNDTANVGRWLAEKSAATNTDVVFGTTAINAWTASSDYIPVTAQLIQDSAFDIEAFIIKALSTRLGRLTNAGYTVGSGSSQPTGIAGSSTFGATTASATAVTFNELLDLKHSVDRDYRVNGTWMFNDNTLLSLKKIALTSANQSLWQMGVVAGEPSTIDGDAYVVNNDLVDMAASSHSILYGDFSKYLIRDAAGIQIRRSEHVNFLNNEITFLGELRTDGKLLDTAAVKHIRQVGT